MFFRKQSANDSVSDDVVAKQKRYEALVHSLHADIFRYAYWLVKDKAVAEDIVQETFLRAWKSLDSLKDEKAAKSWLITILRRENARRFERKQFDLVDMDDVSLEGDNLSNELEIEYQELRLLMAGLNEEYREPLILQVMYGYSGDEIAQQLDLNKNTVMTRLFRARSQLKEALEKSNNSRGYKNG
ncbi:MULTISPECIES: sigma-70 family RNA polymerase sigma factor [Alteromonadaceae]|uniref:sigma-70 family RNA polymerase sigma factor n=1 Tax=Alteromonadaceae TaxID=72275 RepID=UPI001C09A057|nr:MULTISPECIES: sigma-70 family RNA polymerase sigma factor [Aliiglaciecola]MBU2878038.1 sigma-70 family RNA polymerase sigma factor [Aliiglaciecola lipolytica]MDO6709403.1 sigma-70 family RNA polymerase sigma factor [Aliiglaciecola sp. 2_MG-2023]MDO6750551.1 sigma-70 family RNA polymerase sigma factor [Aliiglaciecola sp. 1_MG-2023]